MKFKYSLLFFGFTLGISCINAGAESVNHAPPFQIHQYDSYFEDRYGKEGANSVCWPSSLAGRMIYFQKYRKQSFPKLALVSDPKSNVPKFIDLCHTQLPKGGTRQEDKVPCILNFIKESGYHGYAYVLGKAASDANRKAITMGELRDLLRQDAGVILHVGWMKYDSGRWSEKGSHSLNVYGFEYNGSNDHMTLLVSNPMIDYSSRPPGEMFDRIEMQAPDRNAPPGAQWILSGPGFHPRDRTAVLENVYVFQIEK
jgi:hypothetical protein